MLSVLQRCIAKAKDPFKVILILGACLCAASHAWGKEDADLEGRNRQGREPRLVQQSPSALPPLGKRIYDLGEQRSFRPVIIKTAVSEMLRTSSSRSMRDPEPLLDKVRPSHYLAPHSHPPVTKLVKERPGQLKFKRLGISGHAQQPRVTFTRDRLPIDRADEPTRQDFYDRVFVPAKDDSF